MNRLVLVILASLIGCSSADSDSADMGTDSDQTDASDAGDLDEISIYCSHLVDLGSKYCRAESPESSLVGTYMLPPSTEESSCSTYMLNPQQECYSIFRCSFTPVRDDLLSKGWTLLNEEPQSCVNIQPDFGTDDLDMGSD